MNIPKQGVNQCFIWNEEIVKKKKYHYTKALSYFSWIGTESISSTEKNDPHILSFTSTTQGFQLCDTIMRQW